MPNSRMLAAAGVIIAAALAVLYVIHARSVHEGPPTALASLVADPAPKALPAITFVDASGKPVSLGAFKGRVVILNMWATWCVPCIQELPALAHLAATLGPDKVSVVAVNTDEEPGKTHPAAFLKAHGAANLALYRDPGLSLTSAFGLQGFPFSVVIDKQGREIARATGPMQWDDPAAEEYFKSLAAR